LKHIRIWSSLLVLLSLPLLSCSDTSSPTGNTPVASALSPAQRTLGASSLLGASTRSVNLTDEAFNCTHLIEWFVRFSSPGFKTANHVGIFYNYVGAPPGNKKLEIFWDEENAPTKVAYVPLGPGEVRGEDDALFDLSGVAEHVYPSVREPTRMRVRVNLIVDGLTGNCATVRRVTVTPGEAPLPRFVLQSVTRAFGDSILVTDIPNNRFALTANFVDGDDNDMNYTFRISDGSMRAVTATVGDGSASGLGNNEWGNGWTNDFFGPVAGPAMMTTSTTDTDNLFRTFFATSFVDHFLDIDPATSGVMTLTLTAPGVQPLTILGVLNP